VDQDIPAEEGFNRRGAEIFIYHGFERQFPLTFRVKNETPALTSKSTCSCAFCGHNFIELAVA
jgi:hypothetical protein